MLVLAASGRKVVMKLWSGVLVACLVASVAGEAQADKIKRDKAGLKGISPFREALKKGDDLYVARDFKGAVAAYQKAIKKSPQDPLGHARVGRAHLAQDEIQEAEAAWVAALGFAKKNLVLQARLLFALADLRERQKSLDDADERWQNYQNFVRDNPQTTTYPKTAVERRERIKKRKEMLKSYAAVRERIAKRLKKAEDKVKKGAK